MSTFKDTPSDVFQCDMFGNNFPDGEVPRRIDYFIKFLDNQNELPERSILYLIY